MLMTVLNLATRKHYCGIQVHAEMMILRPVIWGACEAARFFTLSRITNQTVVFLAGPGSSHSPFVFGVDVCAVMQQVLHHSHAVIACCKVQRRRVTSLQIPAVHILSRAQLLQREWTHTEQYKYKCNRRSEHAEKKNTSLLCSLLSNVPFTHRH